MDTIAINTKFLEWDIIAFSKVAGELKAAVFEAGEKLKREEKKDEIESKIGELFLMQEELWQYIQNLEVIMSMYKGAEEELVSITQSLSL